MSSEGAGECAYDAHVLAAEVAGEIAEHCFAGGTGCNHPVFDPDHDT